MAINGFRRTGFWPLDRNVFSSAHLFPAATTHVVLCTTHTAPCEKASTSAVSQGTGVYSCRTTTSSFPRLSPTKIIPIHTAGQEKNRVTDKGYDSHP